MHAKGMVAFQLLGSRTGPNISYSLPVSVLRGGGGMYGEGNIAPTDYNSSL